MGTEEKDVAQPEGPAVKLTHVTVKKGLDLEVGRAMPNDVIRALRLSTSDTIIASIRAHALGAMATMTAGVVVEFPLCEALIYTPTVKAESKPIPTLRVRVTKESDDPLRPEPIIVEHGQMVRVNPYPGDNNDVVGEAGEVINVRPDAHGGPLALLEFVIESKRPEDKGKPPFVLRRNVPVEHLETGKKGGKP